MGVGPRTVTARSTRSKEAQERDPVALALNCTPPQAPTPTPVLFAPNVISPPELPSARKVPRTYRWTLGSARTVVPGRSVSVAPRFTVTLPYMTQMQNVSQLAVPMGPDR